MRELSRAIGDRVVMAPPHLQELLAALHRRGYQVVGPTVRDGAIVYDELDSIANLPIGWTDAQDGGTYRLQKRPDQALFGYAVGPHSWKKYLLPPTLRLWQAERQGSGVQIVPESEAPPKLAFIGVRSCELHAIAVQDKVFVHGPYVDPAYRARRESVCIVAVNCGQAYGTCFCVSMKTGPKATFGFDLALTEVVYAEQHYFMVEVGTTVGAELLQEIPHQPATAEARQAAEDNVAQTATRMGRSLDASDIKPLLYRNYEHPRWDEVLGWSWLFPSYRWQFDARALELTHTIALDGKCLRAKCDEDHSLGYEMVKRFARVIIERLQAARLQLLDVYGVRS